MPDALRIGLLGPLQVRDGDGRTVHAGGRQLRVLLILPALDAGRVVPSGSLAEQIWPGEPPGHPGNALQTLVSRLRAEFRRAGLDDVIESHPAGYRLAAQPDPVDATAFEALAVRGRRALADGDPGEAAQVLRSALQLWGSQPLADAAGCDFADAAAARMTELHASVLADRLGLDPSAQLEQVYLRILGGEEGMAAAKDPVRAADLSSYPERTVAPAPRTSAPPRARSPLTSFVGRDAEVSKVLKALGSARLVTLTGPGGVGKTRLAAEVSGRLAEPAWFAEFAPVTDPAEVAYAVLDTLGIRKCRCRRPCRLPDRARRRVVRVLRLGPAAARPCGGRPAGLRAGRGHAAVARICRSLDGMPLAIELAAV